MKKLRWQLTLLLFNLRKMVRQKRDVLAEDTRKLGVYAVGIGYVAFIVTQDSVTNYEAVYILTFGAVCWTIGVVLTKPKETE